LAKVCYRGTKHYFNFFINSIYMLNSKPNLKLSHTYDSLSNTLWQNKKVVAAKEQERVLLKSRIHHINHPSQHKPSLSSCQIQNQQKYKRLLEKVR